MNAETITDVNQLSKGIDNRFVTNISEKNLWQNLSTRIKITKHLNENTEFNVDAKYLTYVNKNPSDYIINNEFINDQETTKIKNDKNTPISIYSLSSSINGSFQNNLSYKAGIKGISSAFSNNIEIKSNNENLELTSNSIFKEEIWATYFQSNYSILEKNEIDVGLRLEYTNSQLDEKDGQNGFNRKYISLFSSVSLTRKIKKNVNLGISFNRGIERPTFSDIAPFVLFLDQNTLFTGNSNLQPSIVNNFKTYFQYLDYHFSASYSENQNAISRFQITYDENNETQVISPLNLDKYDVLSINLIVPLYISDWWTIHNSFLGLYQQVKGNGMTLNRISLKINQNNNFKLPFGMSLEVSGFFNSPSLNGYKTTKSVYGVDLGISKDINKVGSFTFSIKDVLNSIEYYSNANIENGNIRVINGYDFSQMTFMLTYSYVFGNSKVVGSKSGNDFNEENQRIK